MNRVSRFLVAALTLLPLFASTSIRGTNAAETFWSAKQDSDHYGPVITYISNDGVRMDTEEFIVLIATKPIYEITIYNRDSKGFLKKKITDLRPLKTTAEMKKAGWKVTKGKTETMDGVKVVQYTFNKTPKNKHSSLMELWATNELGTSKGLNEACLRFLCMDDIGAGYGMPLKLFRFSATGKKYVYYDTSTIKSVPSAAACLKLPEDEAIHQVYNLVDLMGKDSPMNLPIK